MILTQPPADPLVHDFRAAMRQLAATVCVVTAGKDDARRGLTATAVCSLSITPPSMLVCVNRQGAAHRAITENGCFCVNILAADQMDVAHRFAGHAGDTGEGKFAIGHWSPLTTGAPALDGALVNLDCTLSSDVETESHSIFIGHVKQVRFGDTKSPLLHYDRHFFSLDNQTAL
ncbi:flavin reductase family protein [Mesorhizobium sp. VNQ89]|uniref:flavin reductase family protein n=1 Tax=Mesorhizobium quangtriensis TaxID=3157709 RepID=UPI0032B710B3